MIGWILWNVAENMGCGEVAHWKVLKNKGGQENIHLPYLGNLKYL